MHRARDLHTFTRLSWRGKQRHVGLVSVIGPVLIAGSVACVRHARHRRDRLKEPLSHAGERTGFGRRGLIWLDESGPPGEGTERPVVTNRHRGQEPVGAPGQRPNQGAGGLVVNRHVDQHHRHVEPQSARGVGLQHARTVRVGGRSNGAGRQAIQARHVDQPGLLEVLPVASGEQLQVAAHDATLVQAVRVDITEPQLVKCRGQRAPEAPQTGNWRHVGQRALLQFVEGGARGNRFGPQPRGWRQTPLGEAQAEAMQTEGGAAAHGLLTDQVVDRFPRRADHQGLSRRRERIQKAVCGGQSSCRGGGPMKRDVAHVREKRRQPGPAPVDATTRHETRLGNCCSGPPVVE